MTGKRRRRSGWIVDKIRATPDPAADAALSARERVALEREAVDLEVLWRALAALDDDARQEPASAAMTLRFERHLARTIEGLPAPEPRPMRRLRFGLAAAAIVLIGIFAVWRMGRQGPSSTADRPAGTPATMARLEAVVATPRAGTPAADSCAHLLGALRDDPSPVVRFAALETFRERCGGPLPAEGLSPLLADESDLLVRLTLIRAIGQYRLTGDAGTLERLARDPGLDPIARTEIARALRALAS